MRNSNGNGSNNVFDDTIDYCQVPPGLACPVCDEDDMDFLLMDSDGDRIRCVTCDCVYDVEKHNDEL